MAKYISHLDLTRCMARAMRRASVPAWYTEGFNPHLFMTFAMPLSLGQEGVRESMDIKLPEDTDLEKIVADMNRTMPEGLEILEAKIPQMKPGVIALADYVVWFRSENEPADVLCEKLNTAMQQEQLMAVKKTKMGERELNLKDYVRSYSLAVEAEKVCMTLRLPAGSRENINPVLLTDCLAKQTGAEFAVQIVRQDAFDENGNPFA